MSSASKHPLLAKHDEEEKERKQKEVPYVSQLKLAQGQEAKYGTRKAVVHV